MPVNVRNKKLDYRPGPFTHPVLGEYHLYCWCGKCQRVQFTWKWMENGWSCPADGCSAVAVDAWRWEEVRSIEPDFALHPIPGRVYKVHAFDWEIDAGQPDEPDDSGG